MYVHVGLYTGGDCVVNGGSVQRPGNKPSLLNFIDFSWEMITFTIIVSVWDGGSPNCVGVRTSCVGTGWAGSNYHISLVMP